jgi:hypothetical protein
MAWARKQPRETNYFIGDIVEFKVGGYGIIDEVQRHGSGWPAKYSTERVEGKPYHPTTKGAWHYEGDFKRLAGESTLRNQ